MADSSGMVGDETGGGSEAGLCQEQHPGMAGPNTDKGTVSQWWYGVGAAFQVASPSIHLFFPLLTVHIWRKAGARTNHTSLQLSLCFIFSGSLNCECSFFNRYSSPRREGPRGPVKRHRVGTQKKWRWTTVQGDGILLGPCLR